MTNMINHPAHYTMRVYYYFRDHGGWFKENYTIQGKLFWTRTTDIRKAYRTDSYWLYDKVISKELSKVDIGKSR